MLFDVPVKDLSTALATVKKGLSPNGGTLPVLAGVRFDAAASDRVRLTTTDLGHAITLTLPARVTRRGEAVIGHRALSQVVKESAKTETATLELGGEDFAYTDHDVTVRLRPLPADEWPAQRQRPMIGDARVLDVEAVANALPAASTDDNRPILTGVYFDADMVVATDSYRLHVVQLPHPHGLTDTILPARTLNHVLSLKRPTIQADDDGAWIEDGPVHWYVRRIGGDFPNFRQLMPSPSSMPMEAVVDPHELATKVRKAAVMAQDKTPVRLEFAGDGTLVVSAVTKDVGNSQSKPMVYRTPAGGVGRFSIMAAYNPRYLLGCLDWPKEVTEVTFGIIDALKPAVIGRTDEAGRRIQRLLMPIRVG